MKKLILAVIAVLIISSGAWAGSQPEKQPRNISPVNGPLLVNGDLTVNGVNQRITFPSGAYLDGNDAGTSVSMQPKAVTAALSFSSPDIDSRLLTELTTYLFPEHSTDGTLVHSYINYLTPASYETDTVGSQWWVYQNITVNEVDIKENLYIINGVGGDEYMCTGTVANTCADDADYSFDDSAGVGFGFCGWFEIPASGTGYFVSKWNGAPIREYYFDFDIDTGVMTTSLYDSSEAALCQQSTAAAALTSGWHYVCTRYDGTGGINANDHIAMTVDGINSTLAANTTCDGGDGVGGGNDYAAMEDTAAPVEVGSINGGASPFQGDFGPPVFLEFATADTPTAAKMLELYNLQAPYMGE